MLGGSVFTRMIVAAVVLAVPAVASSEDLGCELRNLALKGDTPGVVEALARGAEVDSPTPEGATALEPRRDS